jgi:hypothetical protein
MGKSEETAMKSLEAKSDIEPGSLLLDCFYSYPDDAQCNLMSAAVSKVAQNFQEKQLQSVLL